MKNHIMKVKFLLFTLIWTLPLTSQSAIINYDFTIDITDSSNFTSIYNTQNIMIPLSGENSKQYGQGDILQVRVDFLNNQRLQLTTAGDLNWGDRESIGLMVQDTRLNSYRVSGGTSTDFNILEPSGQLFTSSFSQSGGFGASRGAIVSFSSDLTSSTFEVSGFNFDMTINYISEQIDPNLLRLQFVNLNLEPMVVPIPPALWLFCVGLVSLMTVSIRSKDNIKKSRQA